MCNVSLSSEPRQSGKDPQGPKVALDSVVMWVCGADTNLGELESSVGCVRSGLSGRVRVGAWERDLGAQACGPPPRLSPGVLFSGSGVVVGFSSKSLGKLSKGLKLCSCRCPIWEPHAHGGRSPGRSECHRQRRRRPAEGDVAGQSGRQETQETP